MTKPTSFGTRASRMGHRFSSTCRGGRRRDGRTGRKTEPGSARNCRQEAQAARSEAARLRLSVRHPRGTQRRWGRSPVHDGLVSWRHRPGTGAALDRRVDVVGGDGVLRLLRRRSAGLLQRVAAARASFNLTFLMRRAKSLPRLASGLLRLVVAHLSVPTSLPAGWIDTDISR